MLNQKECFVWFFEKDLLISGVLVHRGLVPGEWRPVARASRPEPLWRCTWCTPWDTRPAGSPASSAQSTTTVTTYYLLHVLLAQQLHVQNQQLVLHSSTFLTLLHYLLQKLQLDFRKLTQNRNSLRLTIVYLLHYQLFALLRVYLHQLLEVSKYQINHILQLNFVILLQNCQYLVQHSEYLLPYLNLFYIQVRLNALNIVLLNIIQVTLHLHTNFYHIYNIWEFAWISSFSCSIWFLLKIIDWFLIRLITSWFYWNSSPSSFNIYLDGLVKTSIAQSNIN